MAKITSEYATNASIMANYLSYSGIIVLLTILTSLILWPKPSAEQLVQRGNIELKQDKLNDAYLNYLQAIRIDPKNALAHQQLAVVYDKSRNYPDAINELRIAQINNPNRNLDTEIKQEQLKQNAEKNLKSEIATTSLFVSGHPDFRDGWLRIAYDQYLLKQNLDAKKAAQTAQEIDPNYIYTIKLLPLLP